MEVRVQRSIEFKGWSTCASDRRNILGRKVLGEGAGEQGKGP